MPPEQAAFFGLFAFNRKIPQKQQSKTKTRLAHAFNHPFRSKSLYPHLPKGTDDANNRGYHGHDSAPFPQCLENPEKPPQMSAKKPEKRLWEILLEILAEPHEISVCDLKRAIYERFSISVKLDTVYSEIERLKRTFPDQIINTQKRVGPTKVLTNFYSRKTAK